VPAPGSAACAGGGGTATADIRRTLGEIAVTTTPGDARPHTSADTRRNLLKKAAIGGAVAFAAPTILTRTAAAAASDTTTELPCTFGKGVGVRFRSFGNTGGEEIYVGRGDLGVGANRTARNVAWTRPGTYAFTLVYVPGTVTATVTGPGVSQTATYAAAPSFLNAMEVVLADRDADSQVDLEITSSPIGARSFVGDGTMQILVFRLPKPVTAGFSIAGRFTISGPFSNSQEGSKVDILVGHCRESLPE
jgi:hypothetical protein